MLHEQKLGRGPKQKMLEKALQQYRGMFLLHDAKSLGAVAAENNHHLARAEDVGVRAAEMHAFAPDVGDPLSD